VAISAFLLSDFAIKASKELAHGRGRGVISVEGQGPSIKQPAQACVALVIFIRLVRSAQLQPGKVEPTAPPSCQSQVAQTE